MTTASTPVLELADFQVAAGAEDAFAAAFRQARPLLESSPGCRSLRMTRGLESPSRFVLLVEWDDLACHQAFRDSDRYPGWRALIGPHFDGAPVVEHLREL